MKQRKKARSLFLPRSCISTLTGSHGIAKHRERYGAAAPESLVAPKATTYNTTAGAKVPRRWLPHRSKHCATAAQVSWWAFFFRHSGAYDYKPLLSRWFAP